ncbi:HupE/UreJ family protein [Vibrio sp. E150_011]
MNRSMKSLLVTLLLSPSVAMAHSPIEGFGEFYNGLLHPLFIPAHIVGLLAFGVWFGRQPKDDLALGILALLLGLILGLACSELVNQQIMAVPTMLISVGFGALLLLRTTLNKWVVCSTAALVGLVVGMDSEQSLLVGSEKLVSHLGTTISVFTVVLNTVLFSSKLNCAWQYTAIRILGSWVFTCSALATLVLLTEKVVG